MQADVAGPLRQAMGGLVAEETSQFWARGYRQAREPRAEALWEASRARGAGGSSSSSSGTQQPLGLMPPPGVDPRTIPPPQPTSRLDRIGERLEAEAMDIEDLSD